MVIFEIRNKTENRRLLGYLFYFERSCRFYAELSETIDEWDSPFMFSGHVRKGIYSIDSTWSEKFVRQRIIPTDRQNLGSLLRDNSLTKYDEFKLLLLSEGRCSQDDLYLVRINEKDLIPEISERLKKKILDVMTLKDCKVLVFFKNDESRIADIKKICSKDRLFSNILRDHKKFENVQVSPGGNGIEWGEERFISAEKIMLSGVSSDIAYSDLTGYIKTRLIDTAEMSNLLNCSRQYIKQLVDKERLMPVREGARSNLFLKGNIEAET